MDVARRDRLAARQPRLGWLDVAIGSGLGLLVVMAAWHWRAALIPIDPWDYVEGALNFPDGVWNEVGLSRWAMLAPLMLVGALWGNAEATYYAYPLLAGGLLAAVLYGLAARLVTRWTGIAAALLVCSVPVVFVHLSRGYPDLIATAFVGLALLSLVLARDAMPTPPPDGPPNLRHLPPAVVAWVLLAGASVGWAFEVRELTVLAWPAVAVALWRVGRPLVMVPIFALLPLVALALDMYLSARVYGDPLLKLDALTGNTIDRSEVEADAVYVGRSRGYYMTIPFRILWGRSGGPALVVACAVGLVGGALWFRRLAPVWLWGASLLGLLWLLGGALRPAAPSIRLDIVRYNLAWAVPLVLTAVCVIALGLLALRGWRRAALAVAASGLALASMVPAIRFVTTFEGLAPNGGNALREMGRFLEGYPQVEDVQIWSDWGTQRLIPVYSVGPFGDRRWTAANIRSLNRLLRDPPLKPARLPQPGDLVVVHSQGDQTCYHCAEALADVEAGFGEVPLPGWQEVFRASTGNVVVYRLPEGYVWPTETSLESSRTRRFDQGREATRSSTDRVMGALVVLLDR